MYSALTCTHTPTHARTHTHTHTHTHAHTHTVTEVNEPTAVALSTSQTVATDPDLTQEPITTVPIQPN